jgi:uncharacterized membrane protein
MKNRVGVSAAPIPVSVASDILGRIFGKQTLRDTGWWTLCFAAVITPLTAIAGWLFWMLIQWTASGIGGKKMERLLP